MRERGKKPSLKSTSVSASLPNSLKSKRVKASDTTVKSSKSSGASSRSFARWSCFALALGWIGVLYWGEIHVHVHAQNRCSWPPKEGGAMVMATADPQLVDDYTYRELGKESLALRFVEAVCDAYVRRAMKTALGTFSPDNVVFLGDLFGQGARRDEKRWEELRRRVDSALMWPRNGEDFTYRTVAGNHDVGYSEVIRNHPAMLDRFERWYGKSNFVERIGGVDFVGVNSMVLDGRGSETDNTWAFIEGLSRERDESKENVPRVLLTHLPLPNPAQTCGPLRNSAVIPGRTIGSDREIVYQDYLSDESAGRLLRAIEPELILSGHDHDQCEVVHSYDSKLRGEKKSVTEVTVGTISALNGNDRPSYLMLSVLGSGKSQMVHQKLCFLPEIRKVLRAYSQMAVLTILIILSPPLGELITATKRFEDRRSIVLHLR